MRKLIFIISSLVIISATLPSTRSLATVVSGAVVPRAEVPRAEVPRTEVPGAEVPGAEAYEMGVLGAGTIASTEISSAEIMNTSDIPTTGNPTNSKPTNSKNRLGRQNNMKSSATSTLVVYFSRSGNTELMAVEIAKYYQAVLLNLEAEDYRPGFRGLMNALKDSQSKQAEITPGKVDLSQYDTIFIGSPIWWYSPAPPIWQFVENHHFAGKNVVLFTTFNSSFKKKYIDEFKAEVETQGGHFIDHIYIKRGRISQQIAADTLQEQTRELLIGLPF